MTENKRFKLAYKQDEWWAVRDGEITLWKEEVIHLLNELSEENEELKTSKEYWKNKCLSQDSLNQILRNELSFSRYIIELAKEDGANENCIRKR